MANGEHSDVWSLRLRELDRIGGLALAALILIGIYQLITSHMTDYNSALLSIAESQREITEIMQELRKGQADGVIVDEGILEVLKQRCVPPHSHILGEIGDD